MNNQQEQLDFFAAFDHQPPEETTPENAVPEPSVPEQPPPEKRKLTHAELQQLALGFLASLKPDAIALQVPARYRKYQVTGAGMWRSAKRKKGIEKTAVVVLYETPDLCFNDCAGRDLHLAALHELCAKKELLEAEIRRDEPELAVRDGLFNDCPIWDYRASRNPEYRKLLKELVRLRQTLHQGSRLTHIDATGVADFCYLAVPENLICPEEIASGWGLVYLKADHTFELIREAESQSCATPEGRLLLAQNIAISAAGAVRFQAGIELDEHGVSYRRFPRKKGFRR